MTFLATFRSDGFQPDDLIANNANLLVAIPIVLAIGRVYKRGELLGKITASGKYNFSLAAASDGSQTPAGILVEDVDATAADAPGQAYIRGDFIADGVKYGTGHTAASVGPALRDMGIFLFTAIGA